MKTKIQMWPFLDRLKDWTLVPAVNLGTILGVTFLQVEEVLKIGMLLLTIAWTVWQWRRASEVRRVRRKVEEDADVPKECPYRRCPEECPLFDIVLRQLRDKVEKD